MAASIHREEVSVRHLLDEYTGLPPHLSYYYGEGSSQFEEFDFSRGERYRPNPTMIAAYRYTFRIPLNPVASGVTINATTVNLTVGDNTDFPLGPAGVALDGVALFNPLAAPGDDIEDEKYTFDSNEGHPQQQGAYHYHAVAVGPLAVLQAPGFVTSQSPGTAEIELYGVMCDGTVVMGAKELDGSEAASDLDLQADGQLAHYVTSGETGPAIILLHGGIEGSSGTAGWRFMAPFLGANGFRVFCPDRPGFGLSDKTKVEYLERGKKLRSTSSPSSPMPSASSSSTSAATRQAARFLRLRDLPPGARAKRRLYRRWPRRHHGAASHPAGRWQVHSEPGVRVARL